jgi:RimJ/RimL family protein N-acetyltransferase
MNKDIVASGNSVLLRKIQSDDLDIISKYEYSVSIVEPHGEIDRLQHLLLDTALWLEESGAVAIEDRSTGLFVGTCQFYRSAPCIHGFEIGYVIHGQESRNKGYASDALRLLSDHLFANRPGIFRQQLIIEVWNTASWKVAERAGFLREGIMRSCGFGEGDPADAFVYSRTLKDFRQALASHNGPG